LPKFWGGVCGGEGAELSGWQGENCGLKEKNRDIIRRKHPRKLA